MMMIQKLRNLRLIQDSLDGVKERKKWNRSLAIFFAFMSFVIMLLSVVFMAFWLVKSFKTQATFLMRLTGATSFLICISQAINLIELLFHMLHKESRPLRTHVFLLNGLVGDSYLEIALAFFFSLVVFPHQAKDPSITPESLIEVGYYFVIPSLMSFIFFIRITFLMSTAMFTDVFVQTSLELEDKERKVGKRILEDAKILQNINQETDPSDHQTQMKDFKGVSAPKFVSNDSIVAVPPTLPTTPEMIYSVTVPPTELTIHQPSLETKEESKEVVHDDPVVLSGIRKTASSGSCTSSYSHGTSSQESEGHTSNGEVVSTNKSSTASPGSKSTSSEEGHDSHGLIAKDTLREVSVIPAEPASKNSEIVSPLHSTEGTGITEEPAEPAITSTTGEVQSSQESIQRPSEDKKEQPHKIDVNSGGTGSIPDDDLDDDLDQKKDGSV